MSNPIAENFMEIEILFTIVILILSIVLHEVAHGYAALWLGDQTAKRAGRLTLNPIPHMDLFGSFILPALMALSGAGVIGWAKPVPINPYNFRDQKWGEAIVGAAGPMTNLLIAVFFAILIRLQAADLAIPPEVAEVGAVFIYINIILMLINLIPIPPLDGSKILSALLPFHLQRRYLEFQNLIYSLGPLGLIMVIFFIVIFISRFIFPLMIFLSSFLTGLSPTEFGWLISNFFGGL